MIIFFAEVKYMVRKFSFCSNFYADVHSNIYLLNIVVDFQTVFISWNLILKLNSFIQIGTFVFHKKFLTPRVAVSNIPRYFYFASLMKEDSLLRHIT